MLTRRELLGGAAGGIVAASGISGCGGRKGLLAGAAEVDVSPASLPAIRNGGITEGSCDRVLDPLKARALVMSRGGEAVAIAVVDNCMIPLDVCDEAKAEIARRCGIPSGRVLIAVTHAHSAPSVMDFCLGSRKQADYAALLPGRIAEAVAAAHARMEPAVAGSGACEAPGHTFNRRWIAKPGKEVTDPFGERTGIAHMNPGYRHPDFIGPSGPVDAGLTFLAVRARGGRPIALLANFGNHYFGVSGGFSADYFGVFARMMAERLCGTSGPGDGRFVAMMCQGTSGDLNRFDFRLAERPDVTIEEYTAGLADLVEAAYRKVEFDGDVALAMAETRLTLGRRLPDDRRLAWAREIDARRGDRRPKDRTEVYAEQAGWLAQNPSEVVVLQAARVGGLGITACPNEVYAATGLKLKAQSPLATTMNVTLANGASGYIPPPEQFPLGGYTTWPARTAGLEVDAEPKILEGLLSLLEDVSGASRRPAIDPYPPEVRERIRAALAAAGNT